MQNNQNYTFLDALGLGPEGSKRKMEMEEQFANAMIDYFNEHKGEISQSMVKNYANLVRKGTKHDQALISAGIGAVAGQALLDIFKWAKKNYWD